MYSNKYYHFGFLTGNDARKITSNAENRFIKSNKSESLKFFFLKERFTLHGKFNYSVVTLSERIRLVRFLGILNN